MVQPTIHEDDDDDMKQSANEGDDSSNARPGSNGFSARQSPEKSGSTSPPRKRFSSKKSAKCRIRVVAVSCTEASDAIRRLERIAALLIGKVNPDA